LRSLLHPWHSRILHTFRERREICFESTLRIILRLANMACKAAVFALRTRLRDICCYSS
jgi:hypothetical protein